MALVIHGRLRPEVMPQTLTNKLRRGTNNTEIMIDGAGETWASPARGNVMPQTLTNKLQRAANNTEIMIDGDGETWASPARGYATNAHQ